MSMGYRPVSAADGVRIGKRVGKSRFEVVSLWLWWWVVLVGC
jgi:hypothetical protein